MLITGAQIKYHGIIQLKKFFRRLMSRYLTNTTVSQFTVFDSFYVKDLYYYSHTRVYSTGPLIPWNPVEFKFPEYVNVIQINPLVWNLW